MAQLHAHLMRIKPNKRLCYQTDNLLAAACAAQALWSQHLLCLLTLRGLDSTTRTSEDLLHQEWLHDLNKLLAAAPDARAPAASDLFHWFKSCR